MRPVLLPSPFTASAAEEAADLRGEEAAVVQLPRPSPVRGGAVIGAAGEVRRIPRTASFEAPFRAAVSAAPRGAPTSRAAAAPIGMDGPRITPLPAAPTSAATATEGPTARQPASLPARTASPSSHGKASSPRATAEDGAAEGRDPGQQIDK